MNISYKRGITYELFNKCVPLADGLVRRLQCFFLRNFLPTSRKNLPFDLIGGRLCFSFIDCSYFVFLAPFSSTW